MLYVSYERSYTGQVSLHHNARTSAPTSSIVETSEYQEGTNELFGLVHDRLWKRDFTRLSSDTR